LRLGNDPSSFLELERALRRADADRSHRFHAILISDLGKHSNNFSVAKRSSKDKVLRFFRVVGEAKIISKRGGLVVELGRWASRSVCSQ
jgi:hypothetical protein